MVGGTEYIRTAYEDPTLVVLEGFHAVKHAVRFGAEILCVVASDTSKFSDLADDLAPDVAHAITTMVQVVPRSEFRRILSSPHPTEIVAVARRRLTALKDLLSEASTSPIVCLENPRNMGNLGATIRVSAAAGASGVLTTGQSDPWSPAAVRGAAGLQFAIPVARSDVLPHTERPLIALHPEGRPLGTDSIPARAILVFGTERQGLVRETLRMATARFSIPMEPGVSSLNLATAVAVALYSWRFGSER